MAGKITDQVDGSPAQRTDELPINRGGVDRKLPISSVIAAPIAWNHETDDYTLAESDIGNGVAMDKGTAVELTVPADDSNFDVQDGVWVIIANEGAGAVSVVGENSDVIILHHADFLPTLAGAGSLAVLLKRDVNTWYLSGDLAAA